MTQGIDIPDTPIHTKQVSKMNTITTIPESPDVSDRVSFIIKNVFIVYYKFKLFNANS